MNKRIQWPAVLDAAREILQEYDTSVTLRQLFYRLVAAEVIPNETSVYKRLSSVTAKARRSGDFPALMDRTRTIHRGIAFDGPDQAREWLRRIYRLDRTKNQDMSLYLGCEKHGIIEQLKEWFGEYGIPVVSLGGYSSQTYVDEVVEDIEDQDRPAILIYAGDFDPSGKDILRDFKGRVNLFTEVERIALNAEQIQQYDLPPQEGKATDPRASRFIAEHGYLCQVELDALPPDVLRGLYAEAIQRYWDMSLFEAVMEDETMSRGVL